MNLKEMLAGLPEVVQYIAVLGVVMLILYVCLTLTRVFGQGRGEKIKYDNPEEYEKTVPDVFASTFLKKKIKNSEAESKDENENSQD